MLQTMARSFISRMWSMVMTSTLPVAVTKMSARGAASSMVVDLVAFHRRLQRADRIDLGRPCTRQPALRSDAAEPLPTSPKPQTIATLPAIITSVPRRMPSTSDSRQP